MSSSGVTLDVSEQGDLLLYTLKGRLDAASTGTIWREAFRRLETPRPGKLVVDAAGLDYCDGAGIGLIVELRRVAGKGTEIRGLAKQFQALLEFFPVDEKGEKPKPKPEPPSVVLEVGNGTAAVIKDLRKQIAFVGELTANLFQALLHRGSIRWKDATQIAEAAGVNALPIITLMGFLIGLILAFQSAVPLKQFGAELYVADLVAISVLRELGPLMTAILLAGRSGSAFAAEIGTMKVNEEIDALSTMGLQPVRFLVLPRVLAGVLVAPILTLYFNLLSLIGAGVVVMSFGYPLVTYLNQIHHAITMTALFSGLGKSVVFGLLVAAIGCQRGLDTGTGAIAVGASTTRSVVAGILLTIVVDGVFSVVFYAVGI